MSALNAFLKVANIAEASGVPKRERTKKDAEELCESIADTIIVIDTLVRMHEDLDNSCYIDICGEMETYLQRMAQDIKDSKLKHRGLRGVFCVNDFRDCHPVLQEARG
ncbi:hypothetical protein IW261DRAFT_1419612 [Armillaria novae-zelandiae]|uniref:Uncharacterized protein n=1 Tax=Armillaria novae-zelandiae TaxID=153914 RepID=A0AA39P8F3_9AGAR|nr:hypothetical protein IW261DRAFT_1419612 [Armillaria novae-zelandiae]